MNYRSVADLNTLVLEWSLRLPRDLELIVGIPRSGLLAANLLALHLNLPLTDIDSFAAGRVLSAGPRAPEISSSFLSRRRKVLVVDDSLLRGERMRMARQELNSQRRRHQILYAAVYLQPGREGFVDFFAELLPRPRVFEWHLLHHDNLRLWCMDIDGVLCADPSAAENDDGRKYRRFLAHVPPRIVPSKEIGWLVTCRLEKYRGQTEDWLARHGIRYRQLIMMDYPDAAARRAAANHARFKADAYLDTGAGLFIESSFAQAVRIAQYSGKSVYCHETRSMVDPEKNPELQNPSSKFEHVLSFIPAFLRPPVARPRGQ